MTSRAGHTQGGVSMCAHHLNLKSAAMIQAGPALLNRREIQRSPSPVHTTGHTALLRRRPQQPPVLSEASVVAIWFYSGNTQGIMCATEVLQEALPTEHLALRSQGIAFDMLYNPPIDRTARLALIAQPLFPQLLCDW